MSSDDNAMRNGVAHAHLFINHVETAMQNKLFDYRVLSLLDRVARIGSRAPRETIVLYVHMLHVIIKTHRYSLWEAGLIYRSVFR